MVNLHALAYKYKYRTGWDESRVGKERDPWLMIIPGRFGHVYVHGENTLAFSTTPRRGRTIQRDVEGVVLLQEGDDGTNGTFPTKSLRKVGRILKLYRKKQLSDEQRAALAERARANFHS